MTEPAAFVVSPNWLAIGGIYSKAPMLGVVEDLATPL